MNSTSFIRTFFMMVSLIFMIAFVTAVTQTVTFWTYIWGSFLGLSIGAILIGLDLLFKRFNLRSFNILMLGLFFGYLMGTALLLSFDAILEMGRVSKTHPIVEIAKIVLFLFSSYLGVIMTQRASSEMYVSIPFVKFTPLNQKVRDIILDFSALNDPRIIDLASSSLLDKRLILPRFLLREIQNQEEFGDELSKTRAKRAFDVIKKLEGMQDLHLRYQDTDFSDVKDIPTKILRLARLLDADILTADLSRVQMSGIENVRIVNIHSLSNALKPLMQRGELLKLKIQRNGKEDLQGIGYLEDGTMVVVNGGGGYIGKMIQAYVLSVKHTTTGRIVFCNVSEDQDKNYGEEEY